MSRHFTSIVFYLYLLIRITFFKNCYLFLHLANPRTFSVLSTEHIFFFIFVTYTINCQPFWWNSFKCFSARFAHLLGILNLAILLAFKSSLISQNLNLTSLVIFCLLNSCTLIGPPPLNIFFNLFVMFSHTKKPLVS